MRHIFVHIRKRRTKSNSTLPKFSKFYKIFIKVNKSLISKYLYKQIITKQTPSILK